MQNFTTTLEPQEKLLDLDAYPVTAKAQKKTLTHHHEMEDKVRRAEEQLLALQQKRERLEKEKLELEALSAQQREFTLGKNEIAQMLVEAIPNLESEAENAHRRAEFLGQMHEVFQQHLKVLNTMNADDWDERNLKPELERGMAALEEAQDEIDRFEARLAEFGGAGTSKPANKFSQYKASGNQTEFSQWMRMGFAFALPLMIFTILTLLVVYMISSS